VYVHTWRALGARRSAEMTCTCAGECVCVTVCRMYLCVCVSYLLVCVCVVCCVCVRRIFMSINMSRIRCGKGTFGARRTAEITDTFVEKVCVCVCRVFMCLCVRVSGVDVYVCMRRWLHSRDKVATPIKWHIFAGHFP